ncbi:MAG: AraC family transcriptional regulator [Eubacteriales bacterium]|nr:AraC family transcriptional regulator [Eubacteriales bacterium]
MFSRSRTHDLPFLSCLDVITYCYDSPQIFDNPMGRATSCFCLLVRGSVTIHYAQGEVRARSGDLVYWPESVPYQSHWTGDGMVEFIGIYFKLRNMRTQQNGTSTNITLSPCDRFVVLPRKRRLAAFRCIERYYHHPRQAELAISGFYTLYHEIKPLLPSGKQLRPVVQLAQAYMEANWDHEFQVTELAAHCKLSASRLYHLFKEETGISPIEYKNRARIRHAADLLLGEDLSVEWISEKLGYSSPSYFRRVFRKYMGMTPSEYRQTGGLAL